MSFRDNVKKILGFEGNNAIVPANQDNQERSITDPLMNMEQWMSMFSFGGLAYPFQISQTLQGDHESIPQNFVGMVMSAYKANGIVYAVMLARLMAFSEARFQFRQMRAGRPGDLFGTQELQILENPWPGATTGDLLSRLIQDVDIAGNAFVLRRDGQLRRLRPDWVTILIGLPDEPTTEIEAGQLGSEVLGYAYCPGGLSSGGHIEPLGVDEVAHFAPIPDPVAQYRGISWLTPIVREVMGDSAATSHKLKYWENGATVNLAVTLDPTIPEDKFRKWVEDFRHGHEGVQNAYRTLFLGGGAQVSPVGNTLEQADFKAVQGGGETRIAAAGGVPPVIVGLSEGLQAATYSNYQLAMRRFADVTIRPLWRNLCGSLERIINVPAASQLWYDDRDIPFLRQDVTDQAKILQSHAAAMRQLIDGGFEPKTVVNAITSGDLTRLQHTGLYSVQLQPPFSSLPGQKATPPGSLTSGNGNGAGAKAPVPTQPAQQGQGNGGAKAPVPAQGQGNGAAKQASADEPSPYLSIEDIWGPEEPQEDESNA